MTKYEKNQLRALSKDELAKLSTKDRIERKRIRDRISARNSRQKQKQYLERLEEHTLSIIKEKNNFEVKSNLLEKENCKLKNEIQNLTQLLYSLTNSKNIDNIKIQNYNQNKNTNTNSNTNTNRDCSNDLKDEKFKGLALKSKCSKNKLHENKKLIHSILIKK
ncbi:b-zip transcription factor (eurofung)-related [Anaeramoeba flamelloides]|uniref:B-zip transcription factor (Eurofung)-related n=1 Tax=Anaeramoeba flamelloides TaxID=1746091 RepID=A0ABQ8Y9J2_9EUKA|nr:b-zip transcription factor (eurofung)-related [Anaeramoeba flamelloides]